MALAEQWMKLTKAFLEKPQECCPYCAETDDLEDTGEDEIEARLRVDVCRVRRAGVRPTGLGSVVAKRFARVCGVRHRAAAVDRIADQLNLCQKCANGVALLQVDVHEQNATCSGNDSHRHS